MSVQSILNITTDSLKENALKETLSNANKLVLQERFKLGQGYCEEEQFKNSLLTEIFQVNNCELISFIERVLQYGTEECPEQEICCENKEESKEQKENSFPNESFSEAPLIISEGNTVTLTVNSSDNILVEGEPYQSGVVPISSLVFTTDVQPLSTNLTIIDEDADLHHIKVTLTNIVIDGQQQTTLPFSSVEIDGIGTLNSINKTPPAITVGDSVSKNFPSRNTRIVDTDIRFNYFNSMRQNIFGTYSFEIEAEDSQALSYTKQLDINIVNVPEVLEPSLDQYTVTNNNQILTSTNPISSIYNSVDDTISVSLRILLASQRGNKETRLNYNSGPGLSNFSFASSMNIGINVGDTIAIQGDSSEGYFSDIIFSSMSLGLHSFTLEYQDNLDQIATKNFTINVITI